MPGIPTSPEKLETIKRMIRQGEKPKKIAEHEGVSVNIVYRIVQQVKKEENVVGTDIADVFLPTLEDLHNTHFESTLKTQKKVFPKVVDKETGKVYTDITSMWE